MNNDNFEFIKYTPLGGLKALTSDIIRIVIPKSDFDFIISFMRENQFREMMICGINRLYSVLGSRVSEKHKTLNGNDVYYMTLRFNPKLTERYLPELKRINSDIFEV